mmetsp:Transcript_8615/g.14566  ORF Transcript_8615/g.14566 Transcript_8615/m.14566 type:complete len:165 (-) Transcript_8615:50-544(-)
MKVCEEVFIHNLYQVVNVFLPARRIVERSWIKRAEFHESNQLVWMEPMCPWKEHLANLERENDLEGLIKFVLYKDDRGMVRLQALPKGKSSQFQNRVSIHSAYRGLRGEELSKVAQLPDCEFVHASGFIGGAWSVSSAIQMAMASIEEHNKLEEEKAKETEEGA